MPRDPKAIHCHYTCNYYFHIAECQGKDVEEYEKPTQYALLDVDSVHFSRAPRNSSRLWTQDFMMNIESLVIQKGTLVMDLFQVFLQLIKNFTLQ